MLELVENNTKMEEIIENHSKKLRFLHKLRNNRNDPEAITRIAENLTSEKGKAQVELNFHNHHIPTKAARFEIVSDLAKSEKNSYPLLVKVLQKLVILSNQLRKNSSVPVHLWWNICRISKTFNPQQIEESWKFPLKMFQVKVKVKVKIFGAAQMNQTQQTQKMNQQ